MARIRGFPVLSRPGHDGAPGAFLAQTCLNKRKQGRLKGAPKEGESTRWERGRSLKAQKHGKHWAGPRWNELPAIRRVGSRGRGRGWSPRSILGLHFLWERQDGIGRRGDDPDETSPGRSGCSDGPAAKSGSHGGYPLGNEERDRSFIGKSLILSVSKLS